MFALLLFTFLLTAPLEAESIPFQVCGESTTWVRPSPEVQAKIWNDPRYKDFARDHYTWTHDFLVILDPESTNEHGYLSDLSGVWTAIPDQVMDKCSSSNTRRSGYEWIEVWSLLHLVKEVRREANTYTITVEPLSRGFQWIFIRRLNPSAVLRFVTTGGRELERWDESAPSRQLNNTVPPGTVIVAPNGHIIRK
jgi:hypothetical protein